MFISPKGTSCSQGDKFCLWLLAHGKFMFLRSVTGDCGRFCVRAISAGAWSGPNGRRDSLCIHKFTISVAKRVAKSKSPQGRVRANWCFMLGGIEWHVLGCVILRKL